MGEKEGGEGGRGIKQILKVGQDSLGNRVG